MDTRGEFEGDKRSVKRDRGDNREKLQLRDCSPNFPRFGFALLSCTDKFDNNLMT